MPTSSPSTRELIGDLPSYYPESDNTRLYWMMDAVAHRIDELENDIAAIDRANSVQTADTIDQIAEQARLVDTRPRDTEGKESYRGRVMSRFKLNTSEGTVDDVIGVAADILNVDPEQITYAQSTEAGAVQLKVPGEKLDDLNMTVSDFEQNVNDQSAASYRVDITQTGTLEYTDPDTYSATSDWTGTPGYGEDSDGDGEPDSGDQYGTYSGLL